MKTHRISVTEAARNFADCVNRAHYQQQTFVLVKNGVPVANLGPCGPVVCHGRDLAQALAAVELSTAKARAWQHDLKAARRQLQSPVDKSR